MNTIFRRVSTDEEEDILPLLNNNEFVIPKRLSWYTTMHI